ncbi:hypothetical protein P3S68_028139 [Capsicum galapagoense]
MHWFGSEEDKGLGAKLQGIIGPIRPKFKMDTFGLGYEYTTEEYLDWKSPLGCYCPLPNPLPTLRKTFRLAGFLDNLEKDILKSLRFLFLTEEDGCHDIISEEGGAPSLINEQKFVASSWTVTPSRLHRALGKIKFKIVESEIVTTTKTIQHNISEFDDTEDFEIPQEFVTKVEDFEDKPKENLIESNIVNIGFPEDIKKKPHQRSLVRRREGGIHPVPEKSS